MENPLNKPYEEYGVFIGSIFIGLKILYDFICKRSKKEEDKSDKASPPHNSYGYQHFQPGVISKDECTLNREVIQKWLEVEIRSRILDQKIELQQFVKEEIKRSNMDNIGITERDIELMVSDYIKNKWGGMNNSSSSNKDKTT